MTFEEVERELIALEARIRGAKSGERHLYQPELHKLVHAVRTAGHEVPTHLQELDNELTEAAIEAQFDNLPV